LLVLAALIAIPLSVYWWLVTGVLTSSYDSACEGKVAIKVAFGFSNLGFLLSVGALVAAFATPRQRIGWMLLAIYSVLLGVSYLIIIDCD
jgi:hypothetical protein